MKPSETEWESIFWDLVGQQTLLYKLAEEEGIVDVADWQEIIQQMEDHNMHARANDMRRKLMTINKGVVMFRENIWDTDELKVEYDKAGSPIVALWDTTFGKCETAIVISAAELTAFARHWLDQQGYDVVKRVKQPSIKGDALWQDEHIEVCPLDGFDDTFMIASVTNPERYVFVTDEQLAACHDAVKKREPELLACPVCGGKAYVCQVESDPLLLCVFCEDCSIRTWGYTNGHEAIKVWNALPRKGE